MKLKQSSMMYECPKCETEIEVICYPGDKGQLYGPPEDCYPPEPPTIEPEECDCGEPINQDYIFRTLDEREEL